MRPETILELTRFVLGPGFTLEAIQQLLGEVVERRDHRVSLAPREPLHGRIDVEIYPAGEPSGLMVQLARPIDMDLQPLIDVFGKPQQRPRMKPHHAIPWRFDVPGGWLTLDTASDELAGTHPVARVRIRRRPL